MTATQRPQPCLTRRDGVVCQGTLLPVTDREWHCTEGHVMWGTPSALRSEPWPADLPACPSRSPHTPLGFYCCLVADHPLPHVALDESRQIMATWPTHVDIITRVIEEHYPPLQTQVDADALAGDITRALQSEPWLVGGPLIVGAARLRAAERIAHPIIRGESVRLWHPWQPHAWWPLRCPSRELDVASTSLSMRLRCRRWRWHNGDHWTPDGSEEGIWWH